jgi:hypothetical protein
LAALIGSDEPGHGSQVPQALEVADRFTAQDVRQGHVDQNLAAVSEGDLLSVKAPEGHEPQRFDKRLGVEPNPGNVGSDRASSLMTQRRPP